MNKTTRRQALALLGCSMLTACSEAPRAFVGPGGDPFEGGIGGTGIVGVLVGFGSLLVNGLRVEVDRSTRYHTAFGRVGIDALAAGLPLTIYAQRNRNRILARDVSVDYALIGTVRQSVNGMTINGVPVRPEQGVPARLVPGTRVAVGGVWTRHGVTASFVAPADTLPDLIAGTVKASTQGAFAIGPTTVSYADTAPRAGQYAVAIGRSHDGEFAASEVEVGRFDVAPDLRQLSVEGYLEPATVAPGFQIAGLGHSFAQDLRLAAIGSNRALYFGGYNGTFGASKGYIISDSFAVRAPLLRSGISAENDIPYLSLQD